MLMAQWQSQIREINSHEVYMPEPISPAKRSSSAGYGVVYEKNPHTFPKLRGVELGLRTIALRTDARIRR
jgi:hypothetical protein